MFDFVTFFGIEMAAKSNAFDFVTILVTGTVTSSCLLHGYVLFLFHSIPVFPLHMLPIASVATPYGTYHSTCCAPHHVLLTMCYLPYLLRVLVRSHILYSI